MNPENLHESNIVYTDICTYTHMYTHIQIYKTIVNEKDKAKNLKESKGLQGGFGGKKGGRNVVFIILKNKTNNEKIIESKFLMNLKSVVKKFNTC